MSFHLYAATVGGKARAVFNARDDASARDYAANSDLKILLFSLKSGGVRLRQSGEEIELRPATEEEGAVFWSACAADGPPVDDDEHVVAILGATEPGPNYLKPTKTGSAVPASILDAVLKPEGGSK